MEKYGIAKDDLADGLRIEESQLMGQMARLMGVGEKTSSELQQMSEVENKLHNIRAKLTEIDLSK